jgi:cytochrome oxidase Cu insertion factor (SCO1/SenC/PrrC family)
MSKGQRDLLLGLVLVLAALAGGIYLCFHKPPKSFDPLFAYSVLNQVAPEIAGEDVDGKEFKLSDYRGKVVVLSFWGFW